MKMTNATIFGEVRSLLFGSPIDFPPFETYTGPFLKEACLGWCLASATDPNEILSYIVQHPASTSLSLSEILHAQECYDHSLRLEHFAITEDKQQFDFGFPRQQFLPFTVLFRDGEKDTVICTIRIRGFGSTQWVWESDSREEAFRLALGDFIYHEKHSTLKAYSAWVKKGNAPKLFGLPDFSTIVATPGWDVLRVKKERDDYFRQRDTIRIGVDTWEYDEAGYFVNPAFAFAASPEVSRDTFFAFKMAMLRVHQDQSLKKTAVFLDGDNFNIYTRP